MPKLLEMIHSQHEMVKEIFQKMEGTDSRAEKEKLFDQLKNDIVPHMKGEEKYFYPALEKKEENKEDVLEGIEEHHATKLFLRELNGMSPESEHWNAKVSVLKEMVEHHVEEEEGKIFKEAQDSLSEDDMIEIEEEFENVTSKRKPGRLTRIT